MRFRALFMTQLLELKLRGNGAPDETISHLGLVFGSEIDHRYLKIVPGASGVPNRGEGNDLGRNMEGKGPSWDVKWGGGE